MLKFLVTLLVSAPMVLSARLSLHSKLIPRQGTCPARAPVSCGGNFCRPVDATCCQAGFYCPAGQYCSPVEGYCCRNGEDTTACVNRQSLSLPVGAATSTPAVAALSSSLAVPFSSPAIFPEPSFATVTLPSLPAPLSSLPALSSSLPAVSSSPPAASSSTSPVATRKNSRLSGGVIAGIVVGVAILLIAAVSALMILRKKRRHTSALPHHTQPFEDTGKPELEGSTGILFNNSQYPENRPDTTCKTGPTVSNVAELAADPLWRNVPELEDGSNRRIADSSALGQAALSTSNISEPQKGSIGIIPQENFSPLQVKDVSHGSQQGASPGTTQILSAVSHTAATISPSARLTELESSRAKLEEEIALLRHLKELENEHSKTQAKIEQLQKTGPR